MTTSDKEYTTQRNLQPMLAWAIGLAIIGVMMTDCLACLEPNSTICHGTSQGCFGGPKRSLGRHAG